MTQKPDGGAAFPRENSLSQFSGMTLRDYFAGQALPAIIAGLEGKGTVEQVVNICSEHAYKMADAMIAARDAK